MGYGPAICRALSRALSFQPRINQRTGLRHSRVDAQIAGVQRHSVTSGPQRRIRAAHVAGIAGAHLVQHLGQCALSDLGKAPGRPDFGAGGHKKLHIRIGADHCANIASVKDCAARTPRKIALKSNEGCAHFGNGGNTACSFARGHAAQIGAGQILGVQALGGGHRIAGFHADCTVK